MNKKIITKKGIKNMKKMTKEEIDKLQESGKSFCNYCTNHACECCNVSKLIAKAYVAERLSASK